MNRLTLQHILLANARARRAMRQRQQRAQRRRAQRPTRKCAIPPLYSFP